MSPQPTVDDAYGLALSALERLDHHEEDCIERGKRIEKNQEDAKTERKEMHSQNAVQIALLGGRIDGLVGRAWYLVGALIAGLLTAISVLIGIIWEFVQAFMHLPVQP